MTDASTSRILILFAHPALERSRVNRRLADAARSLPGITFHDLYESYPDLDIDVAHEQALLTRHDIIVLQHPLFWYSTPAILKEWQDLVLQHGWAYGRDGTALHGKSLFNALTTGAEEDSYREGGFNGHTIRQFLAPLERTARLCGMRYLEPFVVHGTLGLDDAAILAHADAYRARLTRLRDAPSPDGAVGG